ncbi:hypothetical protein MuYL_4673 [Mucilaginibacter xinganensis]|uniref:Uncharacterized protein n=1 Tax=Mucilaginibacter xinganensis TaxID=1234841 RepID=A0A223P3A5_9SPHI|nr:hypothetical protein MuYL_4673 [Mucilaginibacter xinganensis]
MEDRDKNVNNFNKPIMIAILKMKISFRACTYPSNLLLRNVYKPNLNY